MLDYKEKYLKYKNKYLNLKGGINNKKESYIGSWNISWVLQENIVAGSESDYAEKCSKKYGNTKINKCYQNTLDIIKNFGKKHNLDLLALQEVSDPDIYNKLVKNNPNLNQHIRHQIWKPNLKKNINVLMCWNNEIYGIIKNELVFNLSSNYDDHRPCSVVLTSKKFLLINVHFPYIETQKDLENITKRMAYNIPEKMFLHSKYHILLGDTNDEKTLISKSTPLILKYNKNSYIFHNNISKNDLKKNYGSCCWHEINHIYRTPKTGKQIYNTGDYILTTNQNILKKQIVYNTSKTLTKYTKNKLNYTSDHYFVLCTLNIN
jgi:hypothetical protein